MTSHSARAAVQRTLEARGRALEDSRRRLEIALDAAAMGTWEWELASGQLVWDERCFALLGFDAEAGQPSIDDFTERVDPRDRDRNLDAMRDAIRDAEAGLIDGAPWRSEFRYRMPDGEIRWLANDAILLGGGDGRVARIVGTTRDVTELRRADERRREKTVQAEESIHAKDRFLAILGHELRTPLTPVVAAVQGLLREPGLAGEHRDRLHMVERNLRLVVRLTDDLLDISRIGSGKLEMSTLPVDLHREIAAAAELCGPELHERRQSLEQQLTAASAVVDGDPARLQQVLCNLLKNASKFTPDGGRIRIATREAREGRLLVEVSDDGVGIEPQLLGRVFDEFEQGGSEVTRRFGGLGLGLAICKALVEAHRGTIRADSCGVGHGATFSVELPARSAAAIAPGAPARRGGTSAVQVPGRHPLEILLVDDHRDTTDVLATVLQGYGWRVATAYDARGALAAAAGARFDVVVSDIGLPDMSGHRLIRTLREQWRRSPFAAIALSGRGRDEDRAASLQAGFSAHLTKPVDIDRLAREIVMLTDPRNESKARQPEAD